MVLLAFFIAQSSFFHVFAHHSAISDPLTPIERAVPAAVRHNDSVGLPVPSDKAESGEKALLFADQAVFEDSVHALYDAIKLAEYNLSYQVFKHAMTGYFNLRKQGRLNNKKLISIIDFTKASTAKRFYTIDLESLAVRFFTYVSHGKNTGENVAQSFSNVLHSNQSSLGFYVTGETYIGSKGYSLRLDGMDKGYNDNMRARAVVMHNADYVSESWIQKYGRLGRSQGCPALPVEIGKKVINTLQNKTLIFAYFNDDRYLAASAHLNPANLFQTLTASAAPVR